MEVLNGPGSVESIPLREAGSSLTPSLKESGAPAGQSDIAAPETPAPPPVATPEVPIATAEPAAIARPLERSLADLTGMENPEALVKAAESLLRRAKSLLKGTPQAVQEPSADVTAPSEPPATAPAVPVADAPVLKHEVSADLTPAESSSPAVDDMASVAPTEAEQPALELPTAEQPTHQPVVVPPEAAPERAPRQRRLWKRASMKVPQDSKQSEAAEKTAIPADPVPPDEREDQSTVRTGGMHVSTERERTIPVPESIVPERAALGRMSSDSGVGSTVDA